MKAITLWQPWASAIGLGLKRYETRSWSTAYRGPLLIHAAKRWTEEQDDIRCRLIRALTGSRKHRGATCEQVMQLGLTLPLGCIVATAHLIEIDPADELITRWDEDDDRRHIERLFGDYSPGRCGWRLEGVEALAEPIPCDGMQGLWTPNGGIIDAIRRDKGVIVEASVHMVAL